MTPSDIAKSRIISQQIKETNFKSGPEMVTYFGAIQGQEYAQTKWSLGLRMPHLKNNDIEKDFTEGRILRTHVLRPTWHFVSPEDIRWLLKLTGPRVNSINLYMYKKMELDDAIFNRCNDIMIATLEGGKQLTREQINQEFKKNKIEAESTRLTCILMKAELDGIICSGGRDGNQFTYALLEERVPLAKEKNHDEALVALTNRYFLSRGPATAKDFSTWSGLTLTDCRKGIEMMKSNFEEEKIESEVYYFSPKIAIEKTNFEQMHLVPIYDEMIMGYKNRDCIQEFRNSIKPAKKLRFDNTIIFDGQIIGSWRRIIKTKFINLEYEFLSPLSKKQELEFEKAVLRFQEFNELEIKL